MNTLEITEIKVKPIQDGNKMKAVASVTFENVFVVHDIKVIEGSNKLFVAMPSRKTPDGQFKDIAHPITSDMRSLLEEKIIEKYNEVMAQVIE